MVAAKKSLKVLLVLANGYEDLEAVAVIDACGWTSYRPHLPQITIVTAGFERHVGGRFGTAFSVDVLLNEVNLEEYAAVALPGGFDSHGYVEHAYDSRLRDLLLAMHGRGAVILTMCVGILPVAAAGLLAGKRATTFAFSRSHDRVARLRELGAIVTGGPVECDQGIISCSGPAHALTAIQIMLESLIGIEASEEVAMLMSGCSAS